jgi:hypothetical protein
VRIECQAPRTKPLTCVQGFTYKPRCRTAPALSSPPLCLSRAALGQAPLRELFPSQHLKRLMAPLQSLRLSPKSFYSLILSFSSFSSFSFTLNAFRNRSRRPRGGRLRFLGAGALARGSRTAPGRYDTEPTPLGDFPPF